MRLFVAIELSKAIKTALVRIQRALGEFDRMVRWIGRDQMHLTLKFLGEVADHRLLTIGKALESAAASACTPFELQTREAGCFPPRGKVRVVWVGLKDSADLLGDCQYRIESDLETIGFPFERRPFSPHLTLGRVREDRSDDQLRRSVEAVAMESLFQPAVSIVLVQSQLTPQGARYTRLGEWMLGN